VRISIFPGDLADAPAEALCTSTNPRLSLMMGTGAAVRGRGGFEIFRACEELVAAEHERSGSGILPTGSAHVTTAGSLRCKAIIHCVASDPLHRSSAAVVRACVVNALAHAERLGCRSIALPLFATGHARLEHTESLTAICLALAESARAVEQIVVVIHDAARAGEYRRLIARLLPGVTIETLDAVEDDDDDGGGWFSDRFRL
jgi:O-acetyl-ADP-ribose deacetylase